MSRGNKLTANPPDRLQDVLDEWGRVLRRARERKALRQEDVADLTGISRFTVAAAERGNPSTSVIVYLAYADVVGVTLVNLSVA